MGTFGSRRGAAENLTLPLMLLAFVAVGGFLYWLNVTAEPTEVAIEEEPTEEESGASVTMPQDTFLVNPAQYDGQVVEVTGARVASRLGPQAFWIGPDDSPFLVKMAPELVEAGTEVMLQTTIRLEGTVQTLTNEVLAAWDSAGAFPNESDMIVAEFAVGSPYIQATSIRRPDQQGGGEEGGQGGGGSGS